MYAHTVIPAHTYMLCTHTHAHRKAMTAHVCTHSLCMHAIYTCMLCTHTHAHRTAMTAHVCTHTYTHISYVHIHIHTGQRWLHLCAKLCCLPGGTLQHADHCKCVGVRVCFAAVYACMCMFVRLCCCCLWCRCMHALPL